MKIIIPIVLIILFLVSYVLYPFFTTFLWHSTQGDTLEYKYWKDNVAIDKDNTEVNDYAKYKAQNVVKFLLKFLLMQIVFAPLVGFLVYIIAGL